MKRCSEKAMIGGVCTGLSQLTGIATIWLRLAFLLAFLWFGAGVLVYVVLWIIMEASE